MLKVILMGVEVLALVYRNLRARPIRSVLTLLGIVESLPSMVRRVVNCDCNNFHVQANQISTSAG